MSQSIHTRDENYVHEYSDRDDDNYPVEQRSTTMSIVQLAQIAATDEQYDPTRYYHETVHIDRRPLSNNERAIIDTFRAIDQQFKDFRLYQFNAQQEKNFRSEAQLIFQDAISSFDIRKNVEHIVSEPLRVHNVASGSELTDRVADLLKTVGLKPGLMKEYPHTLSSGQKQSVGIARSIALNPKFVVADEPISSLDV
jgi:ABC-type dipeptide/oligopeptide/nickel transport system ATPase component